jgi:probable HAF family extracellular repeat protein
VDSIYQMVLSNAIVAAIMALAAVAVSRIVRRPQVIHWLWVLVLVKLVTPPILQVPLSWTSRRPMEPARVQRPLSAPQSGTVPAPKAQQSVFPANGEAPAAGTTPVRMTEMSQRLITSLPRRIDWIAALGWLGVAALIWVLTVFRIWKFSRALKGCVLVGSDVQGRAGELAERLGLRRAPPVWMSPASISPFLWAVGRQARLVVPESLWHRLDQDQRDALLLHELAHLRRRDHWVRLLEIVAISLYWWNPIVWWARRSLREAEEQCCDDWVVWAMKGQARVYAYTLLDTVDFLAESSEPPPLGASGLIEESQLKRRLVRILSGGAAARLSRWTVIGLASMTAGVLLAGPALAVRPDYYHALDLGSLGGASTEGVKLNALGQVVGNSEFAPTRSADELVPVTHGFRTAPDRPIDPRTDDLSAVMIARDPRWEGAMASGINSAGQVALTFFEPIDNVGWRGHGFILDGDRLVDLAPEGIMEEKPTTTAINNLGQFVGVASRRERLAAPAPPSFRSQVVHRSGYRSLPGRALDVFRDDIGHLGGRNLTDGVLETTPWAINDLGQVAGTSLARDGWPHAFRTAPNRPIDPHTDDLGTLGGATSAGRAINNLGQVVGDSARADGRSHAFRTAPDRPIDPHTDDLGTLGGTTSAGRAINSKGDVVGSAATADGAMHAFVFRGERMIDLNTRVSIEDGWILEEARDINDRGQVLVIAVPARNANPSMPPPRRTYLLTPVGDPVPLAMLFLGTVSSSSGLALSRLRRGAAGTRSIGVRAASETGEKPPNLI